MQIHICVFVHKCICMVMCVQVHAGMYEVAYLGVSTHDILRS